MKKLFALLLALALTLGACTVAVAEEPVTITFWHTYGDAETPVINDVIIPMFEAANPGIKVEAIRQSGDFNQMLVTALGTGVVPDEVLSEAVAKVFDMRPAAIIQRLGLRQPIYRQVAAYGHFGRPDLELPWEKCDAVDALKDAVGR